MLYPVAPQQPLLRLCVAATKHALHLLGDTSTSNILQDLTLWPDSAVHLIKYTCTGDRYELPSLQAPLRHKTDNH